MKRSIVHVIKCLCAAGGRKGYRNKGVPGRSKGKDKKKEGTSISLLFL
jgi:hypothetical protein